MPASMERGDMPSRHVTRKYLDPCHLKFLEHSTLFLESNMEASSVPLITRATSHRQVEAGIYPFGARNPVPDTSLPLHVDS